MIKVFLLTTFLTISSVSFNSFDSKPNIALDYDFEDKIVFNVNNSIDTFRIYAYSPAVGVHNKGRISIGNMALYAMD